MKKYLASLMMLFSISAWCAVPLFNLVPRITGPAELAQDQQGTYVYQITNNTNNNFTSVGLANLPSGVTQVLDAGAQYCSSFPLSLSAHSRCLIKLNLNSNLISSNVLGGPQVCSSVARPVYCSQPLNVNQFATTILSSRVSSSCTANTANTANFNNVLSQNLDTTSIDSWGPARTIFTLSASNPNLLACISSSANGIAWQQQRVLAAADFWVKQKLNYCHHHVPDWYTPPVDAGTPRAQLTTSQGGYCSSAIDLAPDSVYYQQAVRWNYNGANTETSDNWLNNEYMWYGMDCSDYTSFVYNFALGANAPFVFNSEVNYQAGQETGTSQDTLYPNTQTLTPTVNVLDNPSAAGCLLCANGDLEHNHSCGSGTNLYFSVFDNTGSKKLTISNQMLSYLQPGDLLYLAFPLNVSPNSSVVTHVIIWTGKVVGTGPNDIPASQIAPNEYCKWQPKAGDWVITDSHYQGADYRIFCDWYQDNLYGVRRVIGTSPPC